MVGLLGSLPLGASEVATGLLGSVSPQTTQLSPVEEAAYRAWLASIGHSQDGGYRVDDTWTGSDYDYRGFFKKYGPVDIKQGQHFTDEFKLPAHRTFSNESVYFNDMTKPFAGSWEKRGERWVYVPFDKRLKGLLTE